MNSFIAPLRWIVRLVGLAAIVLGLVLWTGNGYAYLKLHMWLGFIVTFALLLLVAISLLARLGPMLPVLALVWAVLLPVLGIAQLRIVLGPNHWVIQVVHLILGLGAIGLAETLGARSLRRRPLV